MPLPGDRIPVTVVAGGSGSGKSRLIMQLRAAISPQQRWALLSNSGTLAPHDSTDAGHMFHVAGGCACCVAGPAFRVTLVRLLRAGPWQGLHIEVDPAGHPHTLVDQLRMPPFDQYLTVTQLLLTLRESESTLYGAGADASLGADATPNPAAFATAARLAFATDFLLRTEPGPASPFAAWLESAAPWPRLERAAGRRLVPADSDLPAELPGWRVFSALQSGRTADEFDLIRQWPAHAIARRRAFKDLLAVLAGDSGVSGFQALMRTPRAWYRWSYGCGRGIGPLTFNAGPRIIEAETGWRFDNRVCVWLRPGARREAIDARVQRLDQALAGCDGLPDSAAG